MNKMKKVYLTKSSKKSKPVYKPTQSRVDLLKKNKLKKINSNSKINRKKLKKKLIKIGVIIAGVFVLASSIGGLLVFAYLQDKNDDIPSPDKVFPELPITSEIYDRLAINNESEGTRLYRVIGQFNSDQVDISEVPDHVKLAFIAAEDKDFYLHGGFDPAAILRCGIQYVRNANESCGGSTITQQLVKLTTQRSERALERKIEEILLAIKVEQSYDKDKILEMYLRVTPFGSSIVGIKTAANFYYGKEPKDLTLAEAASLASIIQNPPYLSPTVPVDGDTEKAQENLRERQLYVLDQLLRNAEKFNADLRTFYNDPERDDVITPEIIEEAIEEDWQSKLRAPIATDKKAGHFVNYVLNALQTRNYKNGVEPFTITDLQTGGYRIYTTLDYGIQQIAENYVLKGGNDYSFFNANNAALMTTIPGTGEIIAMAGSKSFYGQKEGCDANGQNCKYDPEVNVLTSLQEPGSSNKPLGYYLGFKEGKYFTGSFLPDIPIKLISGGGVYEPRNWDGSFKGINYTAEQAIRDSRNIPAIIMVESVGVENYIETARQFGYTTFTGSLGPSIVLGGVSVYPVEHAQAYSVFANGGDLVDLDPILKIVDKKGNVVYEATVEKKPVGDPQGIYLLNQAIKNYDGYSWDGRDMAGKTGTTENNQDAWFMGYSPDFVNVCWVGNNNNSPMDPNNGYPPIIVKPWCQAYLREIGESPYLVKRTPFARPGGVYEGGGDCNDSGCLGISRGWLIEGRNPPRDVKRAKANVCVDQEDRLARPIDIALGKSVEKDFSQYLLSVSYLQQYLDEYMGKKNAENPGEFAPNGIPTQDCNIDRSGGKNPFFVGLAANITSGTSVNIKGSSYSNNGNVTSIVFQIRNSGGNFVNFPAACTTNVAISFDVTCDFAGINVNTATAQIRARATDSLGTQNTDVPLTINSGLTFSYPTGNQSCNLLTCPDIVVNYAGSWTLNGNVRLYKENGALVGTTGSAGNTFSFSAAGSGLGTTRYYVEVTSGSLTIRSGLSGTLQIN